MHKIHSWLKRYEWLLAFFVMLAGVTLAQWIILAAPNNLYPQTVDGMGHMAKIKYIADSIRDGVWPSWFPYWYTGATVVQYYPPLSYIWAVPAQLLTDNVMISFKWLTASTMFIGAIGLWAVCKRFIGSGVGLLAGLTYAMQPFLNRSLLISGTLAQAPVYALSPWLLYFSLCYLRSGQRKHWLAITLLTVALILSHAMHAFMVVMCMGIILIVTTITGYNKIDRVWSWAAAIVCAGGLTVFWSLPGVTQLENPGLPNLLPEATVTYTATPFWFSTAARNSTWYYFSITWLLVAVLALLPIGRHQLKPKQELLNSKVIWSIFASFAFSIWLSFGARWTLYSLIPLHQNLVPGRVLSYSSILGSILFAVAIAKIYTWQRMKIVYRLLIILCLLATVSLDLFPVHKVYSVNSYQQIQDDVRLTNPPCNITPGRFSWVWPCTSELSYFPMAQGIMTADGWNIEGTPHNEAIWNHNIAIPAGCPDYITRNLMQWNVRSLFVSNQYAELQSNLEKYGFRAAKRDGDKTVYTSLVPSAYVMQLRRNTLVIGDLADGVVMSYPWMLQGTAENFEDYSPDYISHFKVIYLINPKIKDMQKFENQVTNLVNKDIMVIIEPGRFQPPTYFGVIPYPKSNTRDTPLFASAESGLDTRPLSLTDVPPDAPLLGELDGVLLETNENGEKCPVIGYKNIGMGKVYFVGLSLSEQLESTWLKSRGMESAAPNGEEVRVLLDRLLDLGQPYKDIKPQALPTSRISWRRDGFSFEYNSLSPQPAWVSVTYTPRWQATIDGKDQQVYNLENLILIDLPAGKHIVSFKYRMTWVGKLGLWISGVFLIVFLLVLIKPRWVDKVTRKLQHSLFILIRELFDWQ